MKRIAVAGAFDDLRSTQIRFLQEAARSGPVTVALWDDALVTAVRGACKFPVAERKYLLEAVRFVERVLVAPADATPDALPAAVAAEVEAWVVAEPDDNRAKRRAAARQGLAYGVIRAADLAGFPAPPFDPGQLDPDRPRVVVTGCYDWFHSGHVRFFEECAQLGDLYVVAGHDANVRLLKGVGHPLFTQEERRYVVGSCRYVKQALVSSGMGWMDAEPEIALIRPHMYAVNEDGDKPEKRAFCAAKGIEYVVLKRTPAEGLPPRSSSQLRGY